MIEGMKISSFPNHGGRRLAHLEPGSIQFNSIQYVLTKGLLYLRNALF